MSLGVPIALAQDRLLVRLLAEYVGDVGPCRCKGPDVPAFALGQEPAVLEHLVEDLGRLELAAQVARDRAHDRLEDVGQPVVRDDLLVGVRRSPSVAR